MDLSAGDNEDDDDGFPDPVDPEEEAAEAKKKTGAEQEEEQLSAAMAQSLLEDATRLKDAGNALFKAGDNAAAIATYDEALNAVKDAPTSNEAKELLKPVLISLHNNSAAAQIKLEAWEAAEASASQVLELEADNSKALFRRGMARGKLGQLSSAQQDLLAACKADPKDKNARAELVTVQAALKVQRDGLKSSFSAKFGAAAEKAVAKEEAAERARKQEEARLKALAEERLRAEWRVECDRLRQRQKAQREETRRARLRKFLGDAADAVATERGESSGTLVYSEVMPAPDGARDGAYISIGEVNHTMILPPPPPPPKDKEGTGDDDDEDMGAVPGAKTLPEERTLSALEILKTVVSDALSDFAQALEEVPTSALAEESAPPVTPSPPAAAGANEGADEAQGATAAMEAMEVDEPISFEVYKQQKKDEEKKDRERVEALQKKAKEEADAERRRARKAEKVTVSGEEGLDMKGYKIRADGSKTSYFDRQIDEKTKALLDEQKKPKRLSAGGAEAAPASAEEARQQAAAGSAWNAGGTWEEKEMGDWCKAELTKVLETARGSAEQVQISITKVKSVEGTASVVASRGQVRHIYEYALELEWKAKRLAELPPPGVPPAVDAKVIETKLCSGTLHYAEVSPTATPGTVSGAGCADATHTYKAEVKEPELRPVAAAALEALKADVQRCIGEFDIHFRSKRV
ncbi:40 kda cyclophilin [Chrysochromulina tobinii]|uniref:peptidylprolyl isomerase n=1 Tax=Chrysochromulina tobinii TaxID=1460289 RepID=A0A0M0J9Q6_9EUKA|nr:40 kda cyclophilin [Chrysochromulina tobinii]|eukprot:KOO23334.1 40 kda cyclophilin [Chrysochromulina sp. CCMP291]